MVKVICVVFGLGFWLILMWLLGVKIVLIFVIKCVDWLFRWDGFWIFFVKVR